MMSYLLPGIPYAYHIIDRRDVAIDCDLGVNALVRYWCNYTRQLPTVQIRTAQRRALLACRAHALAGSPARRASRISLIPSHPSHIPQTTQKPQQTRERVSVFAIGALSATTTRTAVGCRRW